MARYMRWEEMVFPILGCHRGFELVQFGEQLKTRVLKVGAPVCVGIDPHLDRLPEPFYRTFGHLTGKARRQAAAAAVAEFCRGVVTAVAECTVAVKPQVAFFEALGSDGVAALEECVQFAKDQGLMVILDGKRGDIGSTAEAYAASALDSGGALACDGMTLAPYLGPESLQPFVRRCEEDKGVFVLVRTSNPESNLWQGSGQDGLAGQVADWIAVENRRLCGSGEEFGPIGAVIGATIPEGGALWRKRMPRAWFLVPGYGAQGAGREDVLQHMNAEGMGALIMSARAILYPSKGRAGVDWMDGIKARATAFHQAFKI